MRAVMTSVLVLLGLASGAATAAVNCTHRFPVGTSYVPYCSNDKHGPAVFVIHGTNGNADDYLGYLDDLDTLVIAPHFQESGPGLYWTSGGWKRGDRSKDAERVSSYEVLDRMVEMYHGVAVAGHSAGGQFVTRYAAGTRMQGLTFIVANPSSYMYLDGTRPVGGNCPDYNEYKYGLEDPNDYMGAGIASDYAERDVIYMLGSLDTKVDKYLDTSCEANRQGRNRYDRGLKFFEHLAGHFGRPVHRKVIVSGVGHSPSRMLDAARPYIQAAMAGQNAGTVNSEAESSPPAGAQSVVTTVQEPQPPKTATGRDPAPAVPQQPAAAATEAAEPVQTDQGKNASPANDRPSWRLRADSPFRWFFRRN